MGVLVQDVEIQCRRHSGLAGLAFVLMAQQIFVGNYVRPMMATRVMHTQQHLAEAGQSSQCFERLSGQ